MTSALCANCPADITTQDGALRCRACIGHAHSRCDGCGQWYLATAYCSDCFYCVSCDRAVPSDATSTLASGEEICSDCRSRFYWCCEECGEYTSDDTDSCDNGCPTRCGCDGCSDERSLIFDYSYKPLPIFHGAGPLYLGLELEVHSIDDHGPARTATSHLGDLGYLKLDNSVTDGFEIVSHPMSYTWALAHFPWEMLTLLREHGCRTSERTGLHVHLSRKGFSSPGHTYRWMKLLYRNEQQIVRLARRSSPDFAAFTNRDRRAVKDYAKGTSGNVRYTAINACNTDTFELRVFASSLDAEEVRAALALADASVEYTRHLTVPVITRGGWTWAAFAEWVAARPQYGPLSAQMETHACAR
ncbi:hypothetical protein [Cryptosporangium arvum]|uniref:Putative amidoligase enzyme n=1 Tax=Cryptosporangium arvum DSM 44712 TaxID=927661 RepID=A0A010Z3K2_9ACTN|nr:hypothetical protein [Cryptosporangium arvum]EXG81978.1 putative amidoligase enzyme [Cryptosporangium arvum DSM 44712]